MSESLSFRDLRDIATHLPAIEILRVRLRRDCISGAVVSRPYFHLSFSEKRNQRFAEISLVESCCAIILFSLVIKVVRPITHADKRYENRRPTFVLLSLAWRLPITATYLLPVRRLQTPVHTCYVQACYVGAE